MSRKRSQIPWEDAKKDALNQFGRTGGEMRNNLARLLHFMSGNEDNSELRKLIDTVKMDREKVFAAVQLSNGDAGTALTEMWKPFRGGINFMNFVKLVHDKLMQQDEYKRYIRRDLLRLIDNGLREEIGEQLKQGTIDKFNEEAEQEGTLASKLKKMWNFIFEHIDDPDVTEVKLLMERVGLYPFVITNRRKSVAEFLFTLFSANRGRVLHEFLNSLYIDLKRDVDKIMQMYGEGGLEDGSGPMEAPVGAPMGVEEEPEEEKSFVIPKELLDQEGYNIAMRDECVHAGDKIHFNVVVAETQLTIESGATVLAHFVGEGTQINLEEGASIIILKAADECEDSPIIINGEALDTANLPIVIEGYTENGEAEEPVRDSGSEDDEDDDLNGFLEEDAPIVIEKDGET
ncbi:hypothetical protein KJ742_07630, partial [Patescibacteria group bacterium]|nr:hypothetical protein [Patescibacteria group bacterium]